MAEFTREERVEKMTGLKASVEEKVKLFNAAMGEDKADEIIKLDKEISDEIAEYATHAKMVCFEDCAATGDAMMEAVKRLSYQIIRTKDENVEGAAYPRRVVEEKDKAIDLIALDKYVEGGIGKDKQWRHIAQKMNYLMTIRVCKKLKVDPKKVSDTYEMSEIASAIEMGKTLDSNTQMLKTLNTLIAAMIGPEYKALSHDVGYLTEIYSKKGRAALSIACANHTKFVGYIAEVAHRIVCNLEYGVEYKAKKA